MRTDPETLIAKITDSGTALHFMRSVVLNAVDRGEAARLQAPLALLRQGDEAGGLDALHAALRDGLLGQGLYFHARPIDPTPFEITLTQAIIRAYLDGVPHTELHELCQRNDRSQASPQAHALWAAVTNPSLWPYACWVFDECGTDWRQVVVEGPSAFTRALCEGLALQWAIPDAVASPAWPFQADFRAAGGVLGDVTSPCFALAAEQTVVVLGELLKECMYTSPAPVEVRAVADALGFDKLTRTVFEAQMLANHTQVTVGELADIARASTQERALTASA